MTDLQAMVDYLEEFTDEAPLPVDYSQRSVGVDFPAGAPSTYAAGDQVSFDLSSLSMTGPGDTRDTEVAVSLGGEQLGTAPVTTTTQAALPGFDEAGTAPVSVTLPADLASGAYDLVVTGTTTGTRVLVPISVEGGSVEKVTPDMQVEQTPRRVYADETRALLDVTLTSPGRTVTGDVTVQVPGWTQTKTLTAGAAQFRLPQFARRGEKTVTISYLGDDQFNPVTREITIWVRPRR
jgi:5'-nucleotidase